MQINRHQAQGILASHVQLKKFKTVQVQLRFFASVDPRQATIRTLMFHMLKAKSKQYPSRRAIARRTEELYDLHLSHSLSMMGKAHVATMSVSFAHPSYLSEKDYFAHVLSFLKTLLHEPLFDEHTLAQEKQFIKDYFDSIYASKARYAQKRFWDHVLEGHPGHQHAYGALEHLDGITLEDIKKAHHTLIHHDACHLAMVGDVEAIASLETVLSALDVPAREGVWPALKHDIQHHARPALYDLESVTQERVFIAYELPVYYGDEGYYAALVLNQILGEGSESLLFQEIRERHSMAYDVHATFATAWGMLVVQAGVSYENLKKTVDMVDAIIKALQTEGITDAQLALAKKTLQHGITQSYDAPRLLSYRLLRSDLLNIPFQADAALAHIHRVTKDDCMRIAQKLKRITIYTLGGETDGQTILSSL